MVAWHDAIKPHLVGHAIAVNYGRSWAMDHLHGDITILNRHYVGSSAADIVWTGLFGAFDLLDNHYHRNIPLAFDETSHIGGGPWTPNTMTPTEGRVEAWEFIVGGGSIYSNFNFTYQDNNEAGEGADSKEFRDYLKLLVDFINGFDFVEMTKYDGLSAAFSGSPPKKHIRAIRDAAGKQCAIYIHHSQWDAYMLHYVLNPGSYTATLALDHLPAGDYAVQWVRPTDLVVLRTDTITGHPGGPMQLQASPEYSIDIAVRILRQK
jgi:hypothetical protein